MAPPRGFHPQSTVTGPGFLDRDPDLERLARLATHGMNTLLIAPRRFGKSSLILETFRRHRDDALCLYVDVFTAAGPREVAERLLAALYEATATRTTRAVDWVKRHIEGLDVAISWEPAGVRVELRGQGPEERDLEATLRSLEKVSRRQKRPVWVAIDEFQRLLELRGGERTMGQIRAVVQHQRDVTYIFSGSKKHVLLGMVEDEAAPFWGQLEVFELGGIDVQHFRTFARRTFRRAGIELADEALTRIADWCRDNPKRIQEALQGLLMTGGVPDASLVDEVVQTQLDSASHMFRGMLDPVRSAHQIRVLRALAETDDEAAAEVYGRAFLERHRLGQAAAVQAAVNALRNQGFLDEDHRFTDPYLKWHLRGHGPS